MIYSGPGRFSSADPDRGALIFPKNTLLRISRTQGTLFPRYPVPTASFLVHNGFSVRPAAKMPFFREIKDSEPVRRRRSCGAWFFRYTAHSFGIPFIFYRSNEVTSLQFLAPSHRCRPSTACRAMYPIGTNGQFAPVPSPSADQARQQVLLRQAAAGRAASRHSA